MKWEQVNLPVPEKMQALWKTFKLPLKQTLPNLTLIKQDTVLYIVKVMLQ